MLSVGMIELGPSDNVALDQPRVAIELLQDMDANPAAERWESVGPGVFNTFLLDTGANSVLAMATPVNDMLEPPLPYQTEGIFDEVGVGGVHRMDISASYRFDFAGSSGIRYTLPDTRILSDPNKDFSMFGPWGLVGMPAMADRVTSFDMRGWSGGGLGLDDLYMKVNFSDAVPDGEEHRYALSVDNRLAFDPLEYLVSGEPPVWADIPFLTAIPTSNGVGEAGNFLFDTGAQISLISQHLAMAIGLDTNGDGLLDQEDDAYLGSETVGGVGGQTSVPVFAIDEVRVPVTKTATGQEVELVWTDLQWLVLDIDVAEGQPPLDGVFGSDLLTSGWFYSFFYPGMPDGYLDQIHLDFRDWGLHTGSPESRSGTIYFDLNAAVDEIVLAEPGIRIRETAHATEVIKGVTTDTYTIGLQTVPTGPVEVTVAAGPGLTISADGGVNFATTLSLTFSDMAAQTITVAAVDDGLVAGGTTSSIAHTVASDDPDYDNRAVDDVTVQILDNRSVVSFTADEAGQVPITLIEAAEGGAEVPYWIRLSDPPAGEVWVQVEDTAGQAAVFNPNNVMGEEYENIWIFSATNWNVAQEVRLTAVDDLFREGPHESQLLHTAFDFDFASPSFGAIIGQNYLNVHLADNDLGQVLVTETEGNTQIAEGGATDTYQIALTLPPSAPVQIAVTADAQTEVSADGGQTFASTLVVALGDTTPRTITVRAVDDRVDERLHIGTITHEITSPADDPKYPLSLSIAAVVAEITDNDLAGMSLAEDAAGQHAITSLSVAEGGDDSLYWVTLASQPKDDVTVYLSSVGEQLAVVADAAPTQAYLQFPALDWNVPQAVRVTTGDGIVGANSQSVPITHSLFSTDPKYQGTVLLEAEISATNLTVTSLIPTSTGFTVAFSQNLDTSVLNLYDQGGLFGPADVTLSGAVAGEIRGSLVIDATGRQATFIQTTGVLPPDEYTLTLTSASMAFRDTSGGLLDGDQDGTPGGDYVGGFDVPVPQQGAITVALPDFARGPRQSVQLPADDPSAGLPLSISSGMGVGQIQLELRYDPQLLEISAFVLADAVLARGGSYQLDVSTPGEAGLTITAAAGVSAHAEPLVVGSFTAQVPDNAVYGDKQVLDLAELQILDTAATPAPLPAIDDDAIHVVAYLADGNGSGSYNSPDTTLTRRIIGQLNSGLAAYPLADPRLIADVNHNGVIQANDTTSVRQAIGLLVVPDIPPLPEGLTIATPAGADPRISIPRDVTAAPGQTITLPVVFEVTEPAGVSVGGFDLLFEFDADKFSVTGAQLGTLLQGTDLVGSLSQPAPGKLIYSADSLHGTSVLAFGTQGQLVTLTVAVAADAAVGPSAFNLLATLGSGRSGVFDAALHELVLDPPPTNAATDTIDGLLTIDDGLTPWHNADNPFDVNDDGWLTPLDALIVINRLNVEAAGGQVLSGYYYDVNDDRVCTAQDALMLINRLNLAAASAAEGEARWLASGQILEAILDDLVAARHLASAH